MKYEKEYNDIAKIIRQANWLMIDAEFKYRQLNRGTSTSNDKFRKLIDEAEMSTARCHNEFMAFIKNDPNLSSNSNVPLAAFPGEASNFTEAFLALDLMKAQESQKEIH